MSALSPFERFKERVIGRVDAMRGRCWFLHQWSGWVAVRNDIIQTYPSGEKGKIGEVVRQHRKCSRCGYVQQKVKKFRTVL
jgi:hypothetical protein